MASLTAQAFALNKLFHESRSVMDIYDLSIGEPRLSTFPSKILENLTSQQNINRYYPSHGDAELREMIIQKYYRESSVDNIAITHGTIGALDFIFRANLDHDAEILIPDPGFPPYMKLAEFSRAKVKRYNINLESDAETCINWDQVESLINAKTKVILINSPHNPTGKIFGQKDFLRFQELLNNFPQLSFILDEVYRDLIYTDKIHHDFSAFIERGYVVGSFSKMYPSQGARIGWVLTSSTKMKLLTPYFNNATGSISSFGQEIVKELLKMEVSYKDNYAFACNEARKILDFYHVEYVIPEGAFFIFIKYEINGSVAAAELSQLGVDVISGAAFGATGEFYIRASFAQQTDILQTGFSIIAKHWNQAHSRVLQ
jgi:aspartate/methionine/tyrosine aminotransferase